MNVGDSEFERRRGLTPEAAAIEAASLAAAELVSRSGSLDLSRFKINDLPPAVTEMPWLTSLDCSGTQLSDLSPLSGITALATLDCGFTKVHDLSPLSGLTALTSLHCANSEVSNLEPLVGLGNLASLDCSGTQVSDLRPLAGMSNLTALNCCGTQVFDLDTVEGLTGLTSLNCSVTQVSDLKPLKDLANLTQLYCGDTRVSDLEPLAHLGKLVVLYCSGTHVSNLWPLASLSNLLSLDCGRTQVNDLGPLAGLSKLIKLNCSRTQVSELEPLAGLRQLALLDFSGTQVSDLEPLAQLSKLASVSCSGTKVSGLGPLVALSNLTAVDCSRTQVSDLEPLAGLNKLAVLDCGGTQVSDLWPLVGLSNLLSLDCGRTQITDLGPLAGLSKLTFLDCTCTQVRDLGPLVSLSNLTSLECGGTQVIDLLPLRSHPLLSELFALDLSKCAIPSEHLSNGWRDNCLPRLRAYWDNLEGGAEPFRQHKLFLLGNGTVGKTQVARALMGAGFDDAIPSTHGIQLHTHPLPAPADPRHEDAGEAFTAKIWDFGGQDIYHGTHALFLKTRAIFLICWDAVSENAREHVIDGVPYRNRPLAYWRDYVREFAGPNAEVILVQTKDDLPGAAAAAAEIAELYPDTPRCSTSAKDEEGFNRLKRLIAEAVGRIEAPALLIIPSSQRRVIDAITAAREAGTRTLDREAFAALCRECGLIGAPEHMLHFLHHTGEVFHAEGRFGGQIIVDQRWAIDAIYAVFDRVHCWQAIKAERGRFTLSLLAQTAWQAFSPADHRHLFSMMLQCGMAFEYIEAEAGQREAVYIAPDLLPDFEDPTVQKWFLREWDPEEAIRTCTIPVPLLHDGLIRALMVAIGKDARMWAVYWKNGVLFHDMTTRALAMIEARWPDPEGWAGEIVITTQRSRARELLSELERHVHAVAERLGVTLGEAETVADEYVIVDDQTHAPSPSSRPAQRRHDPHSAGFKPGRGSPRVPSCYISYAWSDGTEQADANERMVDDLCAAARDRGFEIIRDKTHLASGDSINAFTEEIARAERVAAMIGGRYWTRPDCFAELYGCWTEARLRPDLFREKLREFIFPDAGLYDAGLVQTIAQHWEAEFARCDTMPGAYRDRRAELIAAHADSWVPQCRRIVIALQDKVRSYEADFEAFKNELFAELESLRYKPDHDPDA